MPFSIYFLTYPTPPKKIIVPPGGDPQYNETYLKEPKVSPVAQMVKNLPAVQETWVQSLGQKDPLEKGMATHSSILAWRISWTEEPGRLQSIGSQRVRHD